MMINYDYSQFNGKTEEEIYDLIDKQFECGSLTDSDALLLLEILFNTGILKNKEFKIKFGATFLNSLISKMRKETGINDPK